MEEQKPKLPQEYVETGLALAQSSTIQGYPLMELSREELIAVAAHACYAEMDLKKQLQASRALAQSLTKIR